MEGFGTELGLMNLVLYALGASIVAWFGREIRVLLRIGFEKMEKRTNLVYAHYVKERIDSTGDVSDLLD